LGSPLPAFVQSAIDPHTEHWYRFPNLVGTKLPQVNIYFNSNRLLQHSKSPSPPLVTTNSA